MKIVLLDPVSEIVIHNISIESKQDAQRLDYYWHKEERERKHEVIRVLMFEGMARFMERDDPITVPVRHAGQCLDGGGITCPRIAHD